MPSLTRLPRDVRVDDLLDALDRDGAAIIEAAMSPEQVAAVQAEIAPYSEATPHGRDAFTGAHTRRTGALVARSPTCRALIQHDTILQAARAFLAPYCETIQLHLTQMIRISPGQAAQPLHRDRLAWGGYLPADIEPQFNTIWAVSEFNAGNGATRVAPGSHRWDPTRKAADAEVCQAEMSAGSVLVYTGSVIHGGGAHQGGADRWGLNLTYCLGWLRQEENQYLSCPPAIARTLDPELRALLGYAMGSYALGYMTPPVGPGEGPETLPPELMFGGDAGQTWGGDALFDQVAERAAKGGM